MHNPPLSSVNLRFNPLGAVGTCAFLYIFSSFTHLRNIDLARCGVGDEGMAVLGASLCKSWGKHTKLNLHTNTADTKPKTPTSQQISTIERSKSSAALPLSSSSSSSSLSEPHTSAYSKTLTHHFLCFHRILHPIPAQILTVQSHRIHHAQLHIFLLLRL